MTALFKAEGFKPYVGPMSFRVVVCGGPNFGEPCRGKSLARADEEQAHVWAVLDEVSLEHGFDTVVTAGYRGAAACAYRWPARGHLIDQFPAETGRRGRRAYLRRNDEIVKAGACLVVAFPGGGRFVADLLAKAAAAGIPLRDERDWRPGAGRVVRGEGGGIA